jgi:DHA1 family bicyclomycin/chloramphenicol resistance-like MFS transporter
MTRGELKCLFLIVVIFISACIETDIYLPAFPDMILFFKTSEGAIQSLLTWNFVGICLSGPLYGPVSDSFGRKKPLMIALGFFLIGSLMTLFANDFNQMLWGRVLQGLGSGGCFTLGTAVIFDAFQKEKAIEALNKLNLVIPLVMAGAPLLGGYLNHAFGFRSNFLAIGIFVFLSFFTCLFYFKETLSKENRLPFKAKNIASDFKRVFCNLPFWQLTFVESLIFAGYIVFLSGASVLFVLEFGVGKLSFAFYQAAILGAWVVASLLMKRGIKKWGTEGVKKAGTVTFVIGGGICAIAMVATPENPFMLTLGMLFFALGGNWMTGLYFTEVMDIFPEIKGVTSSLLTSARLLISAGIVGFASYLYNGTIYPIMGVVLGTVLGAMFLAISYERTKNRVLIEE